MKNLKVMIVGLLVWLTALGGIAFGVLVVAPAQAATPEVQVLVMSDNCVEEATIGDIKFYYCEGDYGPDFVANNYGLMWPLN